jgi:hypothetical protein
MSNISGPDPDVRNTSRTGRPNCEKMHASHHYGVNSPNNSGVLIGIGFAPKSSDSLTSEFYFIPDIKLSDQPKEDRIDMN